MLAEQTISKLNEMKMYGLAGAFEQYLEERGSDKLSYDERFSMMVDREYAERQERKLSRRLSIAKLREQACIEDVDYPTIADAILDRIVNRAHRLELKGGTMRKPRRKKK